MKRIDFNKNINKGRPFDIQMLTLQLCIARDSRAVRTASEDKQVLKYISDYIKKEEKI